MRARWAAPVKNNPYLDGIGQCGVRLLQLGAQVPGDQPSQADTDSDRCAREFLVYAIALKDL